MIVVSIGNQIGRQHYVDTLFDHNVATLLPDSQSNLNVRGVVHRIQELLLLDTHVRVRVSFLLDVVVVNSLQLATVGQFHGKLVELQIVPATALREHVVQVASVDEYHHAIGVAEGRRFRRLRRHLSHHLISLAERVTS